MNNDLITIVIVSFELEAFEKLACSLISEGVWRDAAIKGYKVRTDPPDPEKHVLRHVHIAKTKHINAPSQQVSWNDDGSRHDKGKFDANFSGLNNAQQIARQVLELPPDVQLEELQIEERIDLFLEKVGTKKSSNAKHLRAFI